MKRLLLIDVLRGEDSTGLAAIQRDGSVKIAKLASNPLDFFQLPKFKSTLNAYQSKAFIGHNRAATKGAVNTFNAHPYEFGHITGCHNGTLTLNSKETLEKLVGEKFDVDSQALLAAIAMYGVEAIIPEVTGAWSLVWHNSEDNTLNFLRNDQRPMWYAFSKECDKLFWASEWPMIEAGCGLSAKPYEFYEEGEKKFRFFQTPVDTWFRFDLEDLAKPSSIRPKPKAKELKGKAPTPVSAVTGHNPFPRQGASTTAYGSPSTQTKTGGTTKSRSPSDKPITVVHLEGSDDEPFANYIERREFMELAKDGCSFCGIEVDYCEPGVAVFERDQIILCPSCAGTSKDVTRIYTRNLEALL